MFSNFNSFYKIQVRFRILKVFTYFIYLQLHKYFYLFSEHQAKQSDCQSMCEICQEYCTDELKTNTNMKNCMVRREVQYCDVQVPIKTYDTCYKCISKQQKPLRKFLRDNVFTITKIESVFMRKFKLVNN